MDSSFKGVFEKVSSKDNKVESRSFSQLPLSLAGWSKLVSATDLSAPRNARISGRSLKPFLPLIWQKQFSSYSVIARDDIAQIPKSPGIFYPLSIPGWSLPVRANWCVEYRSGFPDLIYGPYHVDEMGKLLILRYPNFTCTVKDTNVWGDIKLCRNDET